MKLLGKYYLAILVWLRLIKAPDFVFEAVTDHPTRDAIEPGTVYVVGGPGFQKWAYFLCPSGSGFVFQLSLQKKRRPRWLATRDFFGRATLYPSVWQLEPPYCHFWIKKGAVHWTADSGQKPKFAPNFGEEGQFEDE